MTAPANSRPQDLPKSSFREWTLAAGVSLLTALAVISPFFFLGTASGHDIAFHMASWLDASGQWNEGILFPRWTEWANFGYGEPRFIFYPPLSWLAGALLGRLVPWGAVLAVLVVSVQTLAGLSAYALLGRLAASRRAALVGMVSFAANPYALLVIYVRSDFAELLAIALFPLLFLAAFRLSGLIEPAPSGFRGVLGFAAVFCAIWLSNAPAAVIATYSAAFLFAFASLQRRSLAPAVAGASGMLAGFCLAGFYLLPAIYEQRWVNIQGALAGGLAPRDNFLYAVTSDPEHDAFNRVASNLAVLLMAAAALGALASWRRGSGRGRALPALSALAAGAALLMLPVSSLAWRVLPELRFVQFPWRWMSVLAVAAAVFLASTSAGRLRWFWPLAAALAIVASGRYLTKHTWWDSEDMPALEAAIAGQAGFEGTDEYDPLGDDRSDLREKQPRAKFSPGGDGEQRIFVDMWTAERRALRVVAPRPVRVEIRLLDYPAWRVKVDGKPARVGHPEATRQMIVEVPAGESRIEIDFGRTRDRTAGGWVSVAAAAGSLAILFRRRAKREG
jgi:hypothetical protein